MSCFSELDSITNQAVNEIIQKLERIVQIAPGDKQNLISSLQDIVAAAVLQAALAARRRP